MKVSAHAIDRYIERVRICSRDRAKRQVLKMAANGQRGFYALVRNDVVITILSTETGIPDKVQSTRRRAVKHAKQFRALQREGLIRRRR